MPASRRVRRPGRRGGSSVWTRRLRRKRVCRFQVGLRGSDQRSRGGLRARCSESSDLEKARMNAEPHAPAADSQRLVVVLENVAIARDTYRLQLEDPVLARAILPGQFLMIRPAAEGADDPLLGRPLALYDVATDAAGAPTAVDVVYLVVGRGTAALARRGPGERLSVWGPLGNGFGPAPAGPVLYVAGGIGQTPFLALGRWWLGKMAYGAHGQSDILPRSGSPAGVPVSSGATLLY